MNKRAPYVFVLLAIVTIGLASCRNSENGALTSERGTTEIRQCRAGIARPISVKTALNVIRRHGFDVVTIRDEGLCSAKDMIAVFDNSENRNWDKVLNTESHINCGIRKKPIYHDHAKIVSEADGNWYDRRYENLECSLEKTGAGSSINRREKFRGIFDQLRRGCLQEMGNDRTPTGNNADACCRYRSSCAGHTKPPTAKEYCNRVNAIDDEYQAKYKDVWKGRVNPNDIASQLDAQVALEHDQLSRLKGIPFPQSHNELARRYLRVLSEFVLSEDEYVRRYRVDKSATRNTTAVRLRAEAKRLSLELAKSCA